MDMGSKVKWSSQAGGRTTSKEGEVVEVVGAGRTPDLVGLAKLLGCAENYASGSARNGVSYVVKVPGKNARCKPRLYWPLTSQLTEVLPEMLGLSAQLSSPTSETGPLA